ncbi:MAG: TetR/AcrR family transcriptional regulator [Lentisphaeria bacterium]|nr:TetR/AcrR family transcriptional regulator [Lentisphaeria bacterium]
MQKRAIETRRKILESAIANFSASGLNGSTVDDIAGSAGVNKQRIYAYFGSKQKLFEAALLEVFLRVKLYSNKTLEKAESNLEQLSSTVFKSFMRVHDEQPALWRLLAWANLEGVESVKVLEQARKEENDALRRLFDRAVEQKLLIPIEFETWLFSLLGISCFYHSNHHTLRFTLGAVIDDDKWIDQLVRDIEKMFSVNH